MLWKTTALLAAALLTVAAAPKPPAKAGAAKAPAAAPARPAPAAKAPAAKPLLNSAGGKASLVGKDSDGVLVTFASPAANFTLLFASCDAQGRACKAVEFDSIVEQPGPTFAQLNAFNQSSAMCRGYEDKTSKPHVVYSTLLFADDPYDHFRTQMQAWTACIAEFRNFLKDPNGYLASAP
jgi:hypothetical protein